MQDLYKIRRFRQTTIPSHTGLVLESKKMALLSNDSVRKIGKNHVHHRTTALANYSCEISLSIRQNQCHTVNEYEDTPPQLVNQKMFGLCLFLLTFCSLYEEISVTHPVTHTSKNTSLKQQRKLLDEPSYSTSL